MLYRDDFQDGSDGAEATAHTEALKRFLIEPVDDLRDLAFNLRVCREEEFIDYRWALEAVRVIAADAHRLAYPKDRTLV